MRRIGSFRGDMASFLLIHGAWHGKWCWERLTPSLAAAGHRVLAPDLPGHGDDETPAWRVSLRSYVEAVHEAARLASEPVIAVGHSMGGLVMTQAAHDAPDLFAARVYVAAFVPESGESLRSLGRADPASEVHASTQMRGLHLVFRRDCARAVFYEDCAEDAAEWAAARLRPNPLRPLLQGVRIDGPVEGPVAYVECTEDRAVTIDHQRCMRDRLRDPHVVTMQASHSPFLSAPKELARHLDEYARLLAAGR